MSEWKEYKLGEITEPSRDIYTPNGDPTLPYIGLEHIEAERLRLTSIGNSSEVVSQKFRFRTNDVLFGKLRPYFRKVIKPDFDGICSTDIWVFRAKEGFDQGYLFYFLANWDFVNTANAGEGGTKMPRADWNYLRETKWSVPPLPEQRTISSVLSSLDDKIDLLHRQNKTLEALAETLWRQWFVENTQQEIRKLCELVVFEKGRKPREVFETPSPGLSPQILIETFDSGKIFFTKSDGMVIAGEKDILVVMDGASSGRVEMGFQGVVGSTIGVFRATANFPFPLFLYYFLKSNEDNVREQTTGSAIPHADKGLILDLDVQFSSIESVKQFEMIAESIFGKKNRNRNHIRTLTQMRDTLLPKLMSGEVRVRV